MHKIILRSVFLGSLGALSLLGGCATVESVEHAQSTADQALTTANAAQSTATAAGQSAASAMQIATANQAAIQTASSGADKANSDVAALGQRVTDLHARPRRGERD